jgi:hypothetical protein
VIRRTAGANVHKTLSGKNLSQKRADGVAQGEGSEYKPQYFKKKKKMTADTSL